MIARCHILLPFELSVPIDESMEPIEYDRDGYHLRLYAPGWTPLSYAEFQPTRGNELGQLVKKLEYHTPQVPPAPALVNGVPTFDANVIRIDFHKTEFDRRRLLPALDEQQDRIELGDPTPRLAFDVANDLFGRLRTIARASSIQTLDPDRMAWRIDYLNDDGTLLPVEKNRLRRRWSHHFSRQYVAVNIATWRELQTLPPEFSPQPWDKLILDAHAMLPDVDAAVALANAALEAFSKWLLDRSAVSAGLRPDLWTWINEREGQGYAYLKTPTVDERFDVLLKIFTGKSLKMDQPKLWQAYKELRQARNTFSHRGRPMIGDKEVTDTKTAELVMKASEAIDWCEQLLPAANHRPIQQERFDFILPVPQPPTAPTLPQ
jgi:hypothetical protein